VFQKNRYLKRIVSVILTFSLILSTICFSDYEKAADTYAARQKSITLTQAKALALSNSTAITKLRSKLALAEIQYKQAVKAAYLKKKNKTTFRWSPLLNFKFPEKLNLEEEYDCTYKPLEKQAAIDGVKHKLVTEVYTVYESVSLSYIKCYTYQERIAFENESLQALKTSLSKNKARLLAGTANEADIKKIESSIDNLETKLNNDMRSFESEKAKLKDMINLDVRNGYTFKNPYVTADISRLKLEDITNYTLKRDEAYYEAQLASSNSLISLNTNYSLMQNQYGSKMNTISTFVSQIKNGEKIDTQAFKQKYDQFLTDIDSPWQGKKRILFVKFPREWLKGSIDGVRYVEDEPYVLYEAALDYQDKLLEEKAVKKDLCDQVTSGFDNYVSVRQTYEKLSKNLTEKREEVDKGYALNAAGRLTFDELSDLQKEYSDLEEECLDALSDYTVTLTSYDKLTCGAISNLLNGESTELAIAEAGTSYVVEEEIEGAYYYIHQFASESAFEFGVYIPEDFELSVTAYELWINGIKIGDKTTIDKSIKHLSLDFDNVTSAFVRLYDDSEVVDDCTIDPQVYSGKLVVKSYTIEKEEDKVVGSYSVDMNQSALIAYLTISSKDDSVKYFDITSSEGVYLASVRTQSIDVPFKYLGFVEQDLEGMTVNLYDGSKNLVYQCTVNTDKKQLKKKDN